MNKNHGGKREGAGRKKNTSVDSLVRITITIYSKQKEFLQKSHKSISAKSFLFAFFTIELSITAMSVFSNSSISIGFIKFIAITFFQLLYKIAKCSPYYFPYIQFRCLELHLVLMHGNYMFLGLA